MVRSGSFRGIPLYTDAMPGVVKHFIEAIQPLVGREIPEPDDAVDVGFRALDAAERAIALDPEILFIDEPSASLDPPTARRLDALVLRLRDALGTTAVVVTHDVATILGIGTRALFLDGAEQRAIAEGPPSELRERGPAAVRAFFAGGVAGA